MLDVRCVGILVHTRRHFASETGERQTRTDICQWMLAPTSEPGGCRAAAVAYFVWAVLFSLFLQGIERDDVVGEFGCHAVGIVLIPGGLVPSTIYSIDDGS